MTKTNRYVMTGSTLLVGLGLLSLATSYLSGWTINLSLPLVMIMLGGVFTMLVNVFSAQSRWAALLYIPGCLLAALGVVFLLNIITSDWKSWAYAWLLLVAGLGLGVMLANRGGLWRSERWPRVINLTGFGLAVGGLTLFALFGAIVGGLFMQIMAPIILVAGGIALYWLQVKNLLPVNILQRARPASVAPVEPATAPPPPDQSQLVEPLSVRELEVLRLIEQGLSNAEIAGKLTLAPSTIKTHINNIYGKLGVQTRIQALRKANEIGLFSH